MNNFLYVMLFVQALAIFNCIGMDNAILLLLPSIGEADEVNFNKILQGIPNIKLTKDTHTALKNFATYQQQSIIYQRDTSPSILDDPNANVLIKITLGLTAFGVAAVYASTYPFPLSRHHILYPATFLSGYVCIEGLRRIFYRDNADAQVASLDIIKRTLDNYKVADTK